MTQSKSEQKDGFQKRGKFWSYRYRVPDPLTGKKKEVRVSGFLTKEEAKAVFEEAIALGKEQLLPMVKKFIPDESTAETWIKIQLEAQLAKWKAGQNVPPATVPLPGSQVAAPSPKA